MRILVTGSRGFIGRNLIQSLKKNKNVDEIIEYNRNNTFGDLKEYCKESDAVFHLAAVLRPENVTGFDDNIQLTSLLLNSLEEANNKCPIMFASSIQADLDNPYGQCKKVEENSIIEYGKKNDVNTYVFRFPNLFGIMSKPNYTSVIATFCYNTIRGLPITINNPAAIIHFAFIEKVLEKVVSIVLENKREEANKLNLVDEYYSVGLGELAYYMETLKRGVVPDVKREDDFYDCLKSTYEWYEKHLDFFEEQR